MRRYLIRGAAALVLLGVGLYFGAAPLQRRLQLGKLFPAVAVCGNGVEEKGEECDDGNQNAEDGCTTTCDLSSCGDGFKRMHVEECDDGNKVDGDGCSSGCQLCPTTATSFTSPDNGHCFWREPQATSYSEAAVACAAKRGHLATYSSDVEWRAVTERLLAGAGAEGVWIGLRQEERNGVRDFAWVSGARLMTAHWAIHEPRRDPSFVCATQSDHGAWAAAPCDQRRQFICERPRWVRFAHAERAYRRFVDPVSWEAAAATCAEYGGRLVTFSSLVEQEKVSRRFPGPIWIGARVDPSSGEFAWSTGKPLTYRDFAPGEPNLLKYQHCLALDIDGRWYNRECDDRNRFVCEVL